jgi:hypothetical protein
MSDHSRVHKRGRIMANLARLFQWISDLFGML